MLKHEKALQRRAALALRAGVCSKFAHLHITRNPAYVTLPTTTFGEGVTLSVTEHTIRQSTLSQTCVACISLAYHYPLQYSVQ